MYPLNGGVGAATERGASVQPVTDLSNVLATDEGVAGRFDGVHDRQNRFRDPILLHHDRRRMESRMILSGVGSTVGGLHHSGNGQEIRAAPKRRRERRERAASVRGARHNKIIEIFLLRQ